MQVEFMRPPEEWATGWEPMTPAQREGLISMAIYCAMDVPFLFNANQNGQNVTKAEASALIGMLQDGGRPSTEYLNSLGRDAFLFGPPPPPQYWHGRHGEPTGEQRAWITQLGTRMGIPMDLVQGALANFTCGQASLLLGRLREAGGQMRNVADPSAWFENEVREVEDELPRSIEVEEDPSELEEAMADIDIDSEADTDEADFVEVAADVEVEG
ncbi:hypothetical protein C8Q70DRAFT_592303 [Cubamyces menziesii]|nr:hypothetical protein C8Q70DRAFT_592303 [Cubamyces menziesii]